MGKASKWFRGLFGLKKSSSSSSFSNDTDHIKKRRWSFVKSYREKEEEEEEEQRHQNDKPKPVVSDPPPDNNDSEKHAIAVAAASAAAAEAAVVAAHAAAAVVRLTSRAAGIREDWAAVRIQSAFRGCLARKALRALKGLVKLQALVRGHIERKRTAEWLHRMQVMMQAQARAIVGRSELTKPHNPFAHHPGPSTPDKVEHVIRSRSRKYDQSSLLRRNSLRSSGRATSEEWSGGNNNNHSRSYSETKTTDDDKSDKIVEIDTAKSRRRNLFHSSDDHEAQSSLMFWGPPRPNNDADTEKEEEVEEASFCTADNSPQFYSASSSRAGPGSSRRSPFTPSKSDGSASFLGGYSDCPNYMTCTESSKAKARSASAPKQRPNYERSGSAKRYPSAHHGGGAGEPRLRVSAALHSSFVNKAYPGSGQLDKLGMPIGYRY